MAEERAQPNPAGKAGDASFVDRIVTDPNNVPDVMLLYGYPGASSEDGHERLYLSPDLVNYVEIPASAILHRMAAPQEQDANGGVTLWVRKDAALIYKMAPAAQALAHYFAGALQAQAAAPARFTPALTVGGPACGVTLPHICQIATAVCTRNTCAAACTAAGPCLTQAADCQTRAATCDCTDFGCRTDVTPCINTHIVTCGACPSVAAVCQSAGVGCHTAGGDCTFIGCGQTLACTQGLLCRGAAAAQPVTVGGPQCGVTLPNVCQVASVGCTFNTCGIACTAFVQCQTHVATCQPCASVNPTCAPFCTRAGCQTPLAPCLTHAATCPAPCTNITPCISIVHPNCQTPFAPCFTPGCTLGGPACTLVGPNCIAIFGPQWTPAQVTPAGWSHGTPCCPGLPVPQGMPVPGMQAQQVMGAGVRNWNWGDTLACGSPAWCTGPVCNTPAQPCTPNCPQ